MQRQRSGDCAATDGHSDRAGYPRCKRQRGMSPENNLSLDDAEISGFRQYPVSCAEDRATELLCIVDSAETSPSLRRPTPVEPAMSNRVDRAQNRDGPRPSGGSGWLLGSDDRSHLAGDQERRNATPSSESDVPRDEVPPAPVSGAGGGRQPVLRDSGRSLRTDRAAVGTPRPRVGQTRLPQSNQPSIGSEGAGLQVRHVRSSATGVSVRGRAEETEGAHLLVLREGQRGSARDI